MTDEQIIDKGWQAEQAKPYLDELRSRANSEITDRINELMPDQTMHFTILRSKALGIEELALLIDADITAGRQAIERMQGEALQAQKGIL